MFLMESDEGEIGEDRDALYRQRPIGISRDDSSRRQEVEEVLVGRPRKRTTFID